MGKKGQLILLGTPIGNIDEIGKAAIEVLREKSVFFVEDTRTFKKLCRVLGVEIKDKSIDSFHDQSAPSKIEKICQLIENGEDVVYASEAGSPMLSDPGLPLVQAVQQRGLAIDSIAGPTSLMKSLELSGLPQIPFTFHGFLPRGTGAIQAKLSGARSAGGTHVFFVAKHILSSVFDVLNRWDGDEPFVIARELSKKFQQVYRGQAKEMQKSIPESERLGEFILLFYASAPAPDSSRDSILNCAQQTLEKGASPKQVAKLLGLILQKPSSELYQEVINGKNKRSGKKG